MFFSTKGIALPDQHIGQEYWGDEARQGVAILNLASWLCLRWVYGLPAGQRKGVALDEMHFLEQLSSGRLMLTEFAPNTRKQNLAVIAAKQEEVAGSDNDTPAQLRRRPGPWAMPTDASAVPFGASEHNGPDSSVRVRACDLGRGDRI